MDDDKLKETMEKCVAVLNDDEVAELAGLVERRLVQSAVSKTSPSNIVEDLRSAALFISAYGGPRRAISYRLFNYADTLATHPTEAPSPEGPPEPECTGPSGSWCPIHGDCTCPRKDDGSPVEKLGAMGIEVVEDPRCPLHGPKSEHLAVGGPTEVRECERWEALERGAELLSLGAAFRGGGLHDAPMYDVAMAAVRYARGEGGPLDVVAALARVPQPSNEEPEK